MNSFHVNIVRPASRERDDYLSHNLDILRQSGIEISIGETSTDHSWPYTSASIDARTTELVNALVDTDVQAIWAARGGYGASDLLLNIPYAQLRKSKSKPLIGFSDISALHAALYKQCSWLGVHGPMPATSLWGKNQNFQDVSTCLELLTGACEHVFMDVRRVSGDADAKVKGILFGGCLSVLTNLIGTPFLPDNFSNHILFFEDTDENPGRVMRAINQWLQAGLFRGVQALVLGDFRNLASNHPESERHLMCNEISRRVECPVFETNVFGHTAPNVPLVIGAQALLKRDKLVYENPWFRKG